MELNVVDAHMEAPRSGCGEGAGGDLRESHGAGAMGGA